MGEITCADSVGGFLLERKEISRNLDRISALGAGDEAGSGSSSSRMVSSGMDAGAGSGSSSSRMVSSSMGPWMGVEVGPCRPGS